MGKEIKILEDHAKLTTNGLSCLIDKLGLSFSPWIYISPLVAFSKAFRQRIRVLFPEPLGPITATTSLLRTSKSISLRTCLSPKYLFSLTVRMIISSSTPLETCVRLLVLVVVSVSFISNAWESMRVSFHKLHQINWHVKSL